MEKPRIEIRFVDGGNDEPDNSGHILISLNGYRQPSIFFRDFDTGNDARIHRGLESLVERVYEMGFQDGELESKHKICNLLDWAKSRSSSS